MKISPLDVPCKMGYHYNGGFCEGYSLMLFVLEKMMSVFNLLAERLAERVGCPVTAIKPETTFGSLGLDSLDLADLLIELENFLGIEIEADGKIQTLNDMTKLVERFVGAISDYCSGESMRQQVAFSGGVGTAKLKISSDHTEGTGV